MTLKPEQGKSTMGCCSNWSIFSCCLSLVVLILVPVKSFGQSESDSVFILKPDGFLEMVRLHHPIAIQAELRIMQGKASLSKSRGSFDPKIEGELSQKQFHGKNYYSQLGAGFKVPTWFGIEVSAGYEQNQGAFLNPEDDTPSSGLFHAGISVPLGQGLFIDKRRAALEKAKIYVQISESEGRSMLNDMFHQAGLAYWDWFKVFYVVHIHQEAVKLASERFEGIKRGFELGDRPAIDTLEAGVQRQNWTQKLLDAQIILAEKRALLSTFLWKKDLIPVEIDGSVQPILFEDAKDYGEDPSVYKGSFSEIVDAHPDLAGLRLQTDQLAVENRLMKERLKPELRINYNALTSAVAGGTYGEYFTKDYAWGLQFELPLFLRKERSQVQITRIEQEKMDIATAGKRQFLLSKANASMSKWEITNSQTLIYSRTVEDSRRLLEGERRMFEIGESSLFMINIRETGLTLARIKQLDAVATKQKALLTTRYYLGLLPMDIDSLSSN